MPNNSLALVLASSSPWRRELLQRFGHPFETIAPDVDETAYRNESPHALTSRLARIKAEAVADSRPEAIVIGADQVAHVDGEILGKPGSQTAARAQLQRQSGREVIFYSGVCVCAPRFEAPRVTVETVTTRFRPLSEDEITRYVDAEDVTATAGSLKSESLGISLVEAIESRDPSTLIGLPLIALRDLLAQAGLGIP